MSVFEDREQAFENKFKYEQDIQFKVACRRARLVGLWAAKRLGIGAHHVESYAREVVSAGLVEPANAGLIRKLRCDFKDKGLPISEHRITRELERQWVVAWRQIGQSAPL